MHHMISHFIQYMQLIYFKDRLRWGAGCLALRIRNGGLKELFVPGELSLLTQTAPQVYGQVT